MAANAIPPNTTLYINNLNDQITKKELRAQLFSLFMTYGKVIDIVVKKDKKMRGQAFLVFTDLAAATSAMRACEGFVFYDKPLRISYAKTKSWATLKREDPNFIPPNSLNAPKNSTALNGTEKRGREAEILDSERAKKREKASHDDDDDAEEMEIDEDEEQQANRDTADGLPAEQRPTATLLCTNLPQEVTDGVLSVLFSQYQGFQTTRVTPAPKPNEAGVNVKIAQVTFGSPELAAAAKEALDGFTLKKGWLMNVGFT